MPSLRFLVATMVLSCATITAPVFAEPQSYVLDDAHTDVTFRVNHLGYSQTHGRFDGVTGTLMIDADSVENSSLDIIIDTSSIDTAWEKRDTHLKTADFFDVANYPTMTFVSNSVSQTGENNLVIAGDLTLLGQSHPVNLDVVINKHEPHPRSGILVFGATAIGKILRSQWGMAFGVPGISDEVDLLFDIEAQVAE